MSSSLVSKSLQNIDEMFYKKTEIHDWQIWTLGDMHCELAWTPTVKAVTVSSDRIIRIRVSPDVTT
jgi:hypothetical protein